MLAAVRPLLIATVASFVLSIAGSAAGEEKDPRVEACAGKSDGATCVAKHPVKEEGKDLRFRDEPGTCQPEECCELDYSQGSPPKSVCAACLSCKPGAPLPPPGDGKADGGDVEPPRTSDGEEPPPTSPGKKGCAVGESGAPFGALVLLVLAAINRRNTPPRSS